MNIAIVICSVGRSEVLDATLSSVFSQSVKPTQIILAVTTQHDVSACASADGRLQVVISDLGSSVQRNAGIRQVRPDCDFVCFLDDDVELHHDFLKHVTTAFADPGVVMVTGTLLADGCKPAPISREKAREIVTGYSGCDSMQSIGPVPVMSGYGCNMCVRRQVLETVTFDERLVLYGWLEDGDFSRQCRRWGRVVRSPQATLVHLGALSGRVSGVRFGFSQIMNPLYLVMKSGVPSILELVIQHWAKSLLANLIYSIIGDSSFDRRGRLKGNLLAFKTILAGHIRPDYILKLKQS